LTVSNAPFAVVSVSQQPPVIAPDGSEIRPLIDRPGGSMVHCSLPPGGATVPVRHRTVEELWFFLEGEGEVWRRDDDRDAVDRVAPGMALSIPLWTAFQFRNTGSAPLRFVIVTMPPWPGDGEAIEVESGRWAPTVARP
jgi:mannose-6-phosphate isomerase-like protein (cupin superfamily)